MKVATVAKRLLRTLGRSTHQLRSVRATPVSHRCKKGKRVEVDLLPHESGMFLGWCDTCKTAFVKGKANGR